MTPSEHIAQGKCRRAREWAESQAFLEQFKPQPGEVRMFSVDRTVVLDRETGASVVINPQDGIAVSDVRAGVSPVVNGMQAYELQWNES